MPGSLGQHKSNKLLRITSKVRDSSLTNLLRMGPDESGINNNKFFI